MRPIVVSFYTVGTPYEDDAKVLAASCDRHGLKHDIRPVATSGAWSGNCGKKAAVIRDALEKHDRILFLDADCEVRAPLPLFDADTDKILLHVVAHTELMAGWQSNRYRYNMRKNLGMWNSGIMRWQSSPETKALADAWIAMCRRRPGEWDQLCLQWAHQEIRSPVVIEPIPVEYRAGREKIAHRSGFHRHWKKPESKPLRDVLLIGSAPYAPKWWARHGRRYKDLGYQIVAVNNACVIPGDDLDLWLIPNDYDGKNRAPEGMPSNHPDYPRAQHVYKNWMATPHFPRTVRTVSFDAVCHLLNEAILDKCRLNLHLVGLDMQFDAERTHFYGTSSCDPLRFGEEKLIELQKQIRKWFVEHGCEVYNAGEQEQTRLIFPRAIEL